MTTERPPPHHCANCGTKLHGRYCSQCGQEDHTLRVPLLRLMGDFLSDQFQFDGRIWQTLHLLLFRPGRLTREYLAGRRQRFIPPVRLYLFVTIVFFVTLGFSPLKTISVRPAVSAKSPGIGRPAIPPQAPSSATSPSMGPMPVDASTLSPLRIATSVGTQLRAAGKSHPASATTGARAFTAWVERHLKPAQTNPREFVRRFWNNAPRVLFFLIPLFALLLKFAYLLRRRYYSEHLIFALHYHSVTFINLFLILLMMLGARATQGAASAVLRWASFALWMWSWLYLFPALRTTYADTWPRAIARGSIILMAYSVAVGMAIVGAVAVTFAMTG